MTAGPIAHSITLPLLACILPIVHPYTMFSQASDAPSHLRGVKENMIHQTRSPSSIAPWSSFAIIVPIVGALTGGQTLAWAP